MSEIRGSKKLPLMYYAVVIAVGGAASYPLGLLKLPSPVGSVAIDAVPGYFFAGYLSPAVGGVIGSIGHLASAASAGFPLGLTHLLIAIQMFVWCWAFGFIARTINRHWALLPAAACAIVLNGVIGPLIVVALGLFDRAMLKTLIPFLAFASFVNVTLASLAILGLSRKRIDESH